MTITLGPQALRRPRRVGEAGVARRRRARRLRDGHGRRAPHAPLPRAARRRGRRAGRPDARPRRARPGARRRRRALPALDRRVGRRAPSTRAGTSCSSSFELDRGVPRWRWQVGDIVLERELAMTHGRAAVGVVHRLRPRRPAGAPRADAALHLAQRPRRALRATARPAVEPTADGFVFEGAYRVAGAGWAPGGEWYRGVRAREEAARGLNDREDVWAAGTFARRARAGRGARGDRGRGAVRRRRSRAAAAIVAAARSARGRLVAQRGRDGRRRRAARARGRPVRDPTDGGPTAVAGYPWFGEWSRDLMTSYEGLFLAHGPVRRGPRGAAPCGRDRLRGDAREHRRHRHARVQHGRRHALVRPRARPPRRRHGRRRPRRASSRPSLERDRRSTTSTGTRFGIGVDPADGLLRQGAEGWALTWMDARIDGVPVTPRVGKPVEVNALWIEALAVARRGSARDATGGGARATGARPRSLRRFVRPRRRAACSTSSTARRRRRVGAAEPAARGLAARTGRSPATPTRRARVVDACRAALLDAARAALARRPTTRATGRYHRGAPGRARRRLPPGHRLAVADRARTSTRRAASASRSTACSTGSRRTSATGGSARSPRPPTAPRRTPRRAARSRPGRWPRYFAPGRNSPRREPGRSLLARTYYRPRRERSTARRGARSRSAMTARAPTRFQPSPSPRRPRRGRRRVSRQDAPLPFRTATYEDYIGSHSLKRLGRSAG